MPSPTTLLTEAIIGLAPRPPIQQTADEVFALVPEDAPIVRAQPPLSLRDPGTQLVRIDDVEKTLGGL